MEGSVHLLRKQKYTQQARHILGCQFDQAGFCDNFMPIIETVFYSQIMNRRDQTSKFSLQFLLWAVKYLMYFLEYILSKLKIARLSIYFVESGHSKI